MNLNNFDVLNILDKSYCMYLRVNIFLYYYTSFQQVIFLYYYTSFQQVVANPKYYK